MSWLSGWSYRKTLTIAPSIDGAQTAYQMKLLVGESAGALGWQVHCAGHAQASFNDLRFTTADGLTLCSYWIEGITGSSPNQLAVVWIKIPSIPASPASTTIYMYYGASVLYSAASGADTFDAFSDFEDAAAWHAGWTDVGTAVVTRDTAVKVERTASLKMVGATALDNTYRTFTGVNYRRVCFKIRLAQTDKTVYPALLYGGSHTLQITFNNNGTITSSNSGTLRNYAADTWYSFEALHDAANHKYSLYIDGVLEADNLDTYDCRTYPLNRQYLRANTVPSTAWLDAWFAAKWTPHEPSWYSYGAEQVDPASYHVILEASYAQQSPEINRTFVVGTDAAGGQVSGSAVTQAEVDLVGERMEAHHDPAIPTGTVAASVAAAILDKCSRDGCSAQIVIPPHCGLELWDVLAVLDSAADQDALYRVAGYELEYDTSRGIYLHRLKLCDV